MATKNVPDASLISTGGLKSKGFKVYEVSRTDTPTHIHDRRDYYKIVLVTGDMIIHYGDKSIETDGTFLFFANPHVPHTVVHRSKERKGYACLFTEAFIVNRERKELLQNSPLFRFDGIAVIPVNNEQAIFLTGLYQKMIAVHGDDDYPFRNELLKSCVELIIHEALRIQPQKGMKEKNAATRITSLFLELLERQFPIEDTKAPLTLRTAQDFASALSVHVNYLNRSVKTVTTKPTSVHIAERIIAEAKALLQHTDWSIADIAYGLGFEYPTYFNNYFKRMTGLTPNSLRKLKV